MHIYGQDHVYPDTAASYYPCAYIYDANFSKLVFINEKALNNKSREAREIETKNGQVTKASKYFYNKAGTKIISHNYVSTFTLTESKLIANETTYLNGKIKTPRHRIYTYEIVKVAEQYSYSWSENGNMVLSQVFYLDQNKELSKEDKTQYKDGKVSHIVDITYRSKNGKKAIVDKKESLPDGKPNLRILFVYQAVSDGDPDWKRALGEYRFDGKGAQIYERRRSDGAYREKVEGQWTEWKIRHH